ncbi:MAG: uroporphyrinogen-III C-methyltransferase [Betaproteobacteria bacterium]|nr:uroporphyrinogen-III C-methyltransferase [Betaproteobacteria bacterium]
MSAGRAYFAAFLDVSGRPCAVVGGGPIAAQKADALLRSGARVRVIAPELCATLAGQAQRGEIEYRAKRFSADDLDGVELAVTATGDAEVNAAVAAESRARRILVNSVDDPRNSTFIMPAVVDRLPLQIAIGSGGAAPVVARRLRALIEATVPAAFGRLAAFAGRYRAASKRRFPDSTRRRRFWEGVFDGPIAQMVFSGRDQSAAEAIEQSLAQRDGAGDKPPGSVFLVGGGPGNPELLTLRAMRALQLADVVLYDHLVAREIVDLARRDAERIYVGKQSSRHALPQQDINLQMVKLARQGKCVVRLKGGDPYIFGRGGEEIETLAANGIGFEVVPGITAAAGVAAYAGIPLTHRDYAHSCVFVTGHRKDGSLELNWSALTQPKQTVVIYMGVLGLAQFTEKLIEHGLPHGTPAAIVERGTLPGQRVAVGTLATLPGIAAREQFKPPSLVIVGDVVRLRSRLAWFEPGE